jgi:hypothetical protein
VTDFNLEEKFTELRAEVEARWVQARTQIEQKVIEVQDSVRQSINDISAKVDDLQARWEEHTAHPDNTLPGQEQEEQSGG